MTDTTDNRYDEPDPREETVRRDLAGKVRKTLGRVPFAEHVLAAYLCAIDPTTPKRVKAILLGALVYFIMPVDAVPDVILALGFTDDAAVFWAAFNSVRAHIKPHHREEAARRLNIMRSEADDATDSVVD